MLCRELFSCCLFGERRTENGEPATGNYSSTYFLGTLGDNPHKIS